MSEYRRVTRRERAQKLLELLTRGPSLFYAEKDTLTREEFAQGWRMWSETWILEQVQELIPELKRSKI